MKFDVSRLNQAVIRARYELAREAGEAMAAAAEAVYLNALSDVMVRATAAGVPEEKSLGHYLRFTRRICELLNRPREDGV